MSNFDLSLDTRSAIVLFSGGMDSTTLLYYAHSKHPEVIAVSFDYNQRHKKELSSAIKIAAMIKLRHEILSISIPRFKGSPLVDTKSKVPEQKDDQQVVTVVPFRNALFLLHACAVAKANKASIVYIGAVAEDQRSYPDCRPIFFKAFENMLKAQEEYEITISSPFIDKTKKEVIELGEKLKVPWEKTWTCYKGEKIPCGECDACVERLEAFKTLGITDPLYKNNNL